MKKILIGLLAIASVSAYAIDAKTSITIVSVDNGFYEMGLTAENGKLHTLKCQEGRIGATHELVFNASPGSFGVLQAHSGKAELADLKECEQLRSILKRTINGETVTVVSSNGKFIEVIINK